MNLSDLAASLSQALWFGIVACVVFCAVVGGIVVLDWAIGRRSR